MPRSEKKVRTYEEIGKDAKEGEVGEVLGIVGERRRIAPDDYKCNSNVEQLDRTDGAEDFGTDDV